MERHLSAILAADVVGYSRLMEADEQATVHTLSHYRQVIDGLIEKHHGRVFGSAGDSVIAEFASPVEAVHCAIEIHQELETRNAELHEDRRMVLRIGINLGDVIVDETNLLGDGVNIAARLETIANPGGICISEMVRMAVGNKLPLDYEDLGEQQVKNIAEPIRAYQVRLKPGAELPRPSERQKQVESSKAKRWQPVIATLVIILIVAGGTAYWFKPWEPREEAASVENMAFPLPDKPSIAVLPLDNMSDDASQEYFADGMTEDLITDLSKNPGLFVIARNSSFSYKGRNIEIRQVAEELGVRYVLEGSVRRAGDQVRINAQLIDATTGGHLWAERYDGQLTDIFALQDQVTQQIVTAMKVSLTGEEQAQQARHATDNAEAHDAFLQGWAHYKLGTPEDLARAIPFFEKAVSLDHNYGLGHAALASIFWDAQVNDWAFDLGLLSFEIEERIDEHLAIALEFPTPLAYDLQARIYLSYFLFDKAVQEAEKAVALDTNDATAHAALANALILADRPDEGMTYIQDAMRLDPYYPPSYLMMLGAAQFGMEYYEEALITFERAVKRNPKSEMSLIYMASCYGHLGRMREAEDTIETANQLRAGLGLGALSLEKVTSTSFTAFTGEIDFPSFGANSAQVRLRAGLSKIPALTWQYLITYHIDSIPGKTWAEIDGATKIDLTTAKSFYNRGVMFVVIGTQTEAVWKNGRVPGAVNLTWYETKRAGKRFRETTFSEAFKKTDEVVIYGCATENYCIPTFPIAKAVNWGYKNIYYFDGGIAAWKEAGYPVQLDN